nr:hypothetical protein [Tanacetum cinerariifolium]
ARRGVGGHYHEAIEVVAGFEQRLAFEAHVHRFAGADGGRAGPVAAPVQHAHGRNAGAGRDVEIGDKLGKIAVLDVEVAVGLPVRVV